jgi:hypothetical protein
VDKHLHIVCLDVPYPVDYGGVFDLFQKIKALHDAGVIIHLHCFEYGRGEQPALNEFCAEVRYYARCEGHKGFSHKLPYIVCSRSSGELLDRLLLDDHPILLEGIHCSYLVNDERFAGRQIVLRLHNVEYQYYRQLYHSERSLFKKLYYLHESNLLRSYERRIAARVKILAVSDMDREQYRTEFGAGNIQTLPVFLPFEEVRTREGTGCFCLYHGNLSVPENEQAVAWLLKNVFSTVELPLIISGKRPSTRLIRLIDQNPMACLIADPSEEELRDLIAKAQVNILPSFNCTGIKLKLLNALYNGRHCIVNHGMVDGTGLEPLCHVANSADEMRTRVVELYSQAIRPEEILQRGEVLAKLFDKKDNVGRLLKSIWVDEPLAVDK